MKNKLLFKFMGGAYLLCSIVFLSFTVKAAPAVNAEVGWKLEKGIWKYYEVDKSQRKGWFLEKNTWYYLDRQNGDMKTGWIKEGNTWYFLNTLSGSEQGKMLTGWQWIDGKCYFFEDKKQDTLGAMYADALSPDGYKLGASGAWVDRNGKEYFYDNKGIQTKKENVSVIAGRRFGSGGSGSKRSSGLGGTKKTQKELASEKNNSENKPDTNKDKKKATPDTATKGKNPHTPSTAEGGKQPHTPSVADDKDKEEKKPPKKEEIEEFEATTGLPVRFDLRNVKGKSYVTSVKNQYYDGGCRSFAALAALESHIKLKEGVELDLSENNMENRHGFVFRDKGVKLNVREGRNRESDLSYFISGRGPIAESDDKYIPCKHDFIPAPYLTEEQVDEVREESKNYLTKAHVESAAAAPLVKKPLRSVTGFEFLKSLDSENITSSDDEQMKQIKEAIKENGAVVSNIYMEHDGNKTFPYSNEKTYNSDKKAYCSLKSNVFANHAVAIVGWDDKFDKENFPEESRPDIDGAWIVKDAQTKYFGDEGYFYVSFKSVQMCTDVYVFTDIRKGDEFKSVYQHDDYGLTGFVRHNQLSGEAKTILFNRYKAGADNGTLDSVGFYTTKPNAEYEIYLIEDFDTYMSEIEDEGFLDETEVADKLNEDKKLIMSGRMSKAGYHTLELPAEYKLKLNKNEVFAVGIHIKNDDAEDPEHKWDMAVEMNDRSNPSVNHGANAKIGSKETYTIAGGEINDLKILENSTGKGINACIKVYCK